MNFEIAYKTLKYLSCGVLMFFILKYVINNKMSVIDIALISVIASLIFAVVENGYSLIGDKQKGNQGDKSQCKSFCAMKEHMNNLSDSTNNMINTEPSNQHALAMVSSNIQEHPKVLSEEYSVASTDATPRPPVEVLPQHPTLQNLLKHDLIHSEEDNIKLVKMPTVHEEEPKHHENLSDYDRFQKRFAEIVEERKQYDKDIVIQNDKISRNADASYTMPYKRRSPDIISSETRAKEGVMKDSDMKYNVVSYHTVPPNLNKGSFEYGYSFLPPANWYPTPPFPPVCVAEKQCPVCPVYTSGTNVDLKEWDSARRFTPPDEINVRYVEEKLNSGR